MTDPRLITVLDDVRAVMRITEAATMRVLDETEALVEDGHAAARLLAHVHATVGAAHPEALAAPMRELDVLVDRFNSRAMEIMAALEFQDVANQKGQRLADELTLHFAGQTDV